MISVIINDEVFCVLENKRTAEEWMELFPACYQNDKMRVKFIDHTECHEE